MSTVAAAAEASGFDTLLVMDHFYQLPMLGSPDQPMLQEYLRRSYRLGKEFTDPSPAVPAFPTANAPSLATVADGWLPGLRRDQPEVARRVEVAGAGVRLPARKVSPRRLREGVRRAMTRRPQAQLIAAAFAAAGGPVAAADALEELVRAPAAVGRPAARP